MDALAMLVGSLGDGLIISPHTEREYERIPCAYPRQWLYLLGDEGVAYSESGNRFAGLDAAGVLAYRAFDAGAEIEDLRLIRNEQQPVPVSGGDLEAIHALAHGIFPGDASAGESPEDCPDPDPSLSAQAETARIDILGIPISLACPAGPWEELCRDCFRSCAASDKPVRRRLSAQPSETGWAIYIDNRKFFSLQHEQQLGLGLLHAARSLLYMEGKYDVAFHAAMVAFGDCGVMLCAPRECGKSTLAAYLVAQGFDFLADEPALLQLDTGSVSPLPLPISLKEGSWSILRPHWPQLAGSPVHLRSDGTQIRMAHPSQQSCSSRSRRLTQIVFPRYALSSPLAEIESLSPLYTLRLLTEGGLLLAKRFAREDFEAFLQLVWRTPAYILRYSSLEEARRMLHEIGCVER
jgi:hypothetical protein